MIKSLLYANNADIKYPLSDFHEEDIPNDILLDLSLSVPYGVIPVLGVLRVGVSFAFACFEDKDTGAPVASVLVTNPRLAGVYPLSMDVDGYGWIVFGPGAVSGRLFYSGAVSVELDPEVCVSLKNIAPTIRMSVNGGLPKDITNVLTITSLSDIVTVKKDGDMVVFERNDISLSDDDKAAFTLSENSGVNERIVYTIDNVSPDENGNIDIDVEGSVPGCTVSKKLELPRGDTGAGEQGPLPLDIFFPRESVPGDPCESSAMVVPEEYDPFDDNLAIIKGDILDVLTNDKKIGTVYTVERD